MDPYKRQDELKVILALLNDIHMSHGVVFNTKAYRNTTKVILRRFHHEGMSFLTKTLPSLAKAMDIACGNNTLFDASSLHFAVKRGTKLPRFLGEFFERVFNPDGTIRENPCAVSVKEIRAVCYLFYKYKLPYSSEQEQDVVSQFVKTEDDIKTIEPTLNALGVYVDSLCFGRRTLRVDTRTVHLPNIVREARILLAKVFSNFDVRDIVPRHGPGAVATKQQLWGKFDWSNVSNRIRNTWPLDEYFYSSQSHVCDRLQSLSEIDDQDLPARVLLVPKDSRGPRLISCEPVDFQWIQQGLSKRIVERLERHPLTSDAIHFSDQMPNRIGALLGSSSGRYATLDLKEASDRVSLALVRLLFPPHICEALENARSSATALPNGKVLPLRKFAPMGSALCFPIMALTIWSILTAAAPDAYVREHILVYGDDVIVPTHYALNAIERLEAFGLKINRAKSCIRGPFKESCGMDAFQGIDVTPVRFRTVWSSSRSPDVYESWVSYANSMYRHKRFYTYDLIVAMLVRIYGPIPESKRPCGFPALYDTTGLTGTVRSRTNLRLQRREQYVLCTQSPIIRKIIDGWSMLLRYFTEGSQPIANDNPWSASAEPFSAPFSVSQYTRRRSSMLVRRWR